MYNYSSRLSPQKDPKHLKERKKERRRKLAVRSPLFSVMSYFRRIICSPLVISVLITAKCVSERAVIYPRRVAYFQIQPIYSGEQFVDCLFALPSGRPKRKNIHRRKMSKHRGPARKRHENMARQQHLVASYLPTTQASNGKTFSHEHHLIFHASVLRPQPRPRSSAARRSPSVPSQLLGDVV